MEIMLKVLSWVMMLMSVFGFARLVYYEKWGRAFVASILAGISLYIMLFF